jgi:hypothetical protein
MWNACILAAGLVALGPTVAWDQLQPALFAGGFELALA